MIKANDDYKTVRLPKSLTDKVDNFIKENPDYTSRADLIKEAVRTFLREFMK